MSETTCACGGTGMVAVDSDCKHESQTAGGRACTCAEHQHAGGRTGGLDVLVWEPGHGSGVVAYTDPVTDEHHTCCIVAGRVQRCARCRIDGRAGICEVERLAATWVRQHLNGSVTDAWVAVFPHDGALVVAGTCWQPNQVSARCDLLDQAHTPAEWLADSSVTPAAAERWARWTEHGQQVMRLTRWAASELASADERRQRAALRAMTSESARAVVSWTRALGSPTEWRWSAYRDEIIGLCRRLREAVDE